MTAKAAKAKTTIKDVYDAINPLPARLLAKGKVNPDVRLEITANANMAISMSWKKYGSVSDWEKDYNHVFGENFEECMSKADALIVGLPSAEEAKLHAFMNKLGKLIDVGKSEGIQVDYLNPLLDTMKRLSENCLTYRPEDEPVPY